MSLNLKDEETVALVTEVAKRLGTTKTAAVRQLARERLDELDHASEEATAKKVREITAWLERDVWPQTRGLPPITKEDVERITGMDEMFDR